MDRTTDTRPNAGRGSARRGRGGGASSRGRGQGAGASTNTFKRKLAGTPLGQSRATLEEESDNDGSGTEASQPLDSKGVQLGSKFRDSALYDSDAEAARKTRFETVVSENRYMELKPLREKERKDAIAAGLIPDPLKPRRLDEAITFQGTCTDMCPEFEREEREYQKNVDKWELIPGTNRIDRNRAVKAFHRPAAGNEQPMPSDVRPPHILKSTLDYLFHDILAQDPDMMDSHPFLRDRTRAIRQDFTLQNDRGELAIECHERIARYHILCLHVLREWENFSESQELEQLRKVLQSLNEFYDDARHEGMQCPHEAEFRAYYLITHLRDSDTIRQTELLPLDLFDTQYIQSALHIQSLALRNNESRGERGRRPANSEASLNAFSRFFKAVASDQTSYVLACLAESHFVDIRRGALVALKKAYIPQHPKYPIVKLAKMLGCDDAEHCAEVVTGFGLNVYRDASGAPEAVELHRGVQMTEYPPSIKQRASKMVVEVKRGRASLQAVIDGNFYSAHVDIDRTRLSQMSAKLAARPPVPSPAPTPKRTASTGTPAKLDTLVSAAFGKSDSAFTKPPMQSTSAFGALNAAAPSFVPSKPPANASKALALPPTSKLAESSAFAPALKTPKTSVPHTVQPIPTRPPLSPLQRPPTTLKSPPPPTPKVPEAHSIATPALSQGQPPVKIMKQSSHANLKVTKAANLLWGRLLHEYATSAGHKAAIEALGAVKAEQLAERQANRARMVNECSADLLDMLLDGFAVESARIASTQYLARRKLLRRYFEEWRIRRDIAVEARKIREDRKSAFSTLAREIVSSPSRNLHPDSRQNDPMLLDRSVLEPDRAEETPAEVNAFWRPNTLSAEISQRLDATFATYKAQILPDWRVIFIVSSLDGLVASWYRCKLGMKPEDEGLIVMTRHVRVEYSLVSAAELAREELEYVGLAVLNIDNTSSAAAMDQTELAGRLERESTYVAHVMQINWKDDSNESDNTINVHDVNGGFAEVMHDVLKDIKPNNSNQPRQPAKEIIRPYQQCWQLALQKSLTRASFQPTLAILVRLAEDFVELLVKLKEEVDAFVVQDGTTEALPILLLESGSSSNGVASLLHEYLNQKQFATNMALSYLSLQLLGSAAPSPLESIKLFFETLAGALADSYEPLYADAEATPSELKASLAWFEEEVDNTAKALAKAISDAARVSGSLSGKKRSRNSAAMDASFEIDENGGAKKSRDQPSSPALDKAPASALLPKKVLSLTDLINQTKALLNSK